MPRLRLRYLSFMSETMADRFFNLGHMLIIPLQHSPTLSLIPESEVREKTRTEMQKYRRALHEMLTSTSKDLDGNVRLGAVTWEISRSGGVHLVWQFLPIPAEFVLDGRAEAAFDANAENLEYPKFRKSFDDAGEVETGDYLKVMIWSHERSTEMVLPLSRDFRFDLQFPRKTLAMLLGLESRMDWRKCAQSGEEEEADAEAFKKIFEKFDLE